jgi:hypothetical protein
LDSYKKGLKTTDIKREEISRRNSRVLPLFDQKSNEENLDDLKIEPSGEKLRRYKSNWLRHVKLMNKNEWLPKLMLNYAPNGRSRLGRPLKKVLDEVETGLSRPNLRRRMMTIIMMKIFVLIFSTNFIVSVGR